MNKKSIYVDLKFATEKLLETARGHSWNEISDNCLYITTEIQDAEGRNFHELRKLRKKANDDKTPESLEKVTTRLIKIFGNLYELDLLIYKSTKVVTVIEIQYYLKSYYNNRHFEDLKEKSPMLHSKVAIPPYSKSGKEKFDINWELGGLRHKWNMFWWQKKIKKELKKLNKLKYN